MTYLGSVWLTKKDPVRGKEYLRIVPLYEGNYGWVNTWVQNWLQYFLQFTSLDTKKIIFWFWLLGTQGRCFDTALFDQGNKRNPLERYLLI